MAGLGVTETAGHARTRSRRRLPGVLAVASGLCCAAAFPPWDMGPLAFVALAPLLVAMGGVPPRRAAGLGYLSGLSFYLATIWWVINTMTTYGGMPVALSLIALGLLAGVLAGYTGTFAWLYALGAPSLPVPLRPVAAAALWTALEFLRSFLFSGFPWALLGYTQYRQPGLRLLAALTGVYGLSAVLMLVNATIAETVGCWGRRAARPGWRRDLMLAWGLAAVTLAGVWAYGAVWWRDPTGGPAVGVGLLQGNIDQAVKWDRGHQARTLETYERLARQAAVERPSLIVWPETAVPFFLRREPELGGTGPGPGRGDGRADADGEPGPGRRTGSSITARSSSARTADSRDGTTNGTSSPSGSTSRSSGSSFFWTSWSPGSVISGGASRQPFLPAMPAVSR